MSNVISPSPTPAHFYRVRKGDTLLGVAGEAYGVRAGGERLSRAQLINRHPFNWRFHRPSEGSFNERSFPEGVVSMMARYSCDDAAFEFPQNIAPAGSCFPIVFVPPVDDVWHRPPPEVVQLDISRCWAAAILSWSKAAPSNKRFRSIEHVVETFRKVSIDLPLESGWTPTPLVTKKGALRRLPAQNEQLALRSGEVVDVAAGQLTVEALATALGVEFLIERDGVDLGVVVGVLRRSAGPVIAMTHSAGRIGHATVLFGASTQQRFLGEMDPFGAAPENTGPAFGPEGTRWLPTSNAFALNEDTRREWDEMVLLFRQR